MSRTEEPETSRSSGFFVIRTPLVPYEEFLAWGEGLDGPSVADDAIRLEEALAADRIVLRSRLRDAMTRSDAREALFIASPDLDESLEVWMRHPESQRGVRVERALVRYFVRSAGRPTPFGLFAGCSVGRVGSATRLRISGRQEYRRRTRLDSDYLAALADALAADATLRDSLTYRPNSSLYRAAGRLRYAESRIMDRVRTHHLVAVEITGYLEATLRRAETGARRSHLAEALTGGDADVSMEAAARYVDDLIDSQILVPDLAPPVTGEDPIRGLSDELRRHDATRHVAARLESTRRSLEALDQAGLGNTPLRYRTLARELDDLPAKVDLRRLFQVDMFKPAPDATLDPGPLREIALGVEILRRVAPVPSPDPLSSFREAFMRRYGERELRLVEALDEEIGVGFSTSKSPDAEGSPLLDGLTFPSSAGEGMRWEPRHSFLLCKLDEVLRGGEEEIVLQEKDLEELSDENPRPMPDAFAATATLASASEEAIARGDYRVLLHGAFGPSGARLLGRFCHADEKLRAEVERHLREEESLEPDAIFAEIVHLPEGRLGNVLARPVLREHEIPFLGRSGTSLERQIPVTDLMVSVAGDRIVLRSARLQRRVIPRLTCAHNYTWRSLALYRFLGMLQGQEVAAELTWSWGPLADAPFLPRVVTGRLVLSRRRWLLDHEELRRVGKTQGADRFLEIQRWRMKRRMPRYVELADTDNLLPVDLSNILSIDSFVELVKGRERAALVESFPGSDELCASGPEGHFVHELILPFIARRRNSLGAPSARPPASTAVERSCPPGSSWLYVKLYTGTSTADQVIQELVRPLTRHARQSGAADRWFFLRYGDPDWHLRLRIRGDVKLLWTEVLASLQDAAASLMKLGLVWRTSIDTYEREVERYGGPFGIDMAERIFDADSEAVLAILETLSGDEGADARWRLALLGMDALLSDLGYDLAAKRALVKGVRERLKRQFRVDKKLEIQLGEKFRRERRSLETLLGEAREENHPLAAGIAALRRRSTQISSVVRDLKAAENAGKLSHSVADMAPGYLHMHVNRLLRVSQNAQEWVLYDFLGRLYESWSARTDS